ncbi:hypothetical protein PL9631_850070 [Planktothrix paucivesiculata PCC 9631]|uniref:Uncharacterized protein n=1 Tax=Planktothrix paucivesiculata PCC 9631 TaxID=671071 RepID=A0A7Z9C3J2_9CYAN|nr:hypothetical protein PL9631_850070 [Planktothrix paucivesiculata PCC 9631]
MSFAKAAATNRYLKIHKLETLLKIELGVFEVGHPRSSEYYL